MPSLLFKPPSSSGDRNRNFHLGKETEISRKPETAFAKSEFATGADCADTNTRRCSEQATFRTQLGPGSVKAGDVLQNRQRSEHSWRCMTPKQGRRDARWERGCGSHQFRMPPFPGLLRVRAEFAASGNAPCRHADNGKRLPKRRLGELSVATSHSHKGRSLPGLHTWKGSDRTSSPRSDWHATYPVRC